MGNLFKWNMFFTSFLPLWTSIIISDIWSLIEKGIKFFGKHPIVGLPLKQVLPVIVRYLSKIKVEGITVIILLVAVIVSVHQINKEIAKQEANERPPKGKIVRAKRANKLSAEFLLAYILPMIAFNYEEVKSIVLFLIYFAVLSYLCIRNNNVYTNIYLEFKKYKMYDCDIQCDVLNQKKEYKDCLIISKNNLAQTVPRDIYYFDFENYIYIEVGGNK